MSRKVVIGVIIIIVISIIAGIGIFVFSSLHQQQTQQSSSGTNTQLGALSSNTGTVDPLGDPDNDGLTNAQEALWGTNPNNPDTDGDGFSDGKEVAACHNPLVPSPNDKLQGCTVGQQSNTPSAAASTSSASGDPFFTGSPDLTGGSINLTQAYGSAVKDSDKSPVTFSQFISNQPIATDLPLVNNAAIKKEADSQLALAQYMNVAGDIDPLTDKTRFQLAINALLTNGDASQFEVFANKVSGFEDTIKALQVPPQAMQYDTLLLGYSKLLAATFSQIANYPNDQVKGLVALRQLDAIDRQYYPQITQQRAQLLALTSQPQ